MKISQEYKSFSTEEKFLSKTKISQSFSRGGKFPKVSQWEKSFSAGEKLLSKQKSSYQEKPSNGEKSLLLGKKRESFSKLLKRTIFQQGESFSMVENVLHVRKTFKWEKSLSIGTKFLKVSEREQGFSVGRFLSWRNICQSFSTRFYARGNFFDRGKISKSLSSEKIFSKYLNQRRVSQKEKR